MSLNEQRPLFCTHVGCKEMALKWRDWTVMKSLPLLWRSKTEMD